MGRHFGVETNVSEGGFEFMAHLIDKGDTAAGFAQGAIVFAVEPEGDSQKGDGEPNEVEEHGARKLRRSLRDTG